MRVIHHVVGGCAMVLSLAALATASELYSVEFAALTPLYRMNQATGAATAIGPTGFDNVADLTSDTRPGFGQVYGVRIPSNQLLRIDPATGGAVVAANLNSPNNMVSIALNPTTGRLYGNTSVSFGAPFDALYEIDAATGNSTFIGRITFDDVFALGFSQGGTLYGVADATNQLISISTVSGNGTLVAPLQAGTIFDLASRPEDDVMFAVDSGTGRLWTLDTTNGALTDVGPYGAPVNLVGLAFSAVPEPGTLALLALALPVLAMRRRRS